MAEAKPIQTVGRRKTSVARVLFRQGQGELSVNGRPLAEYFPRDTHQIRVSEPLKAAELEGLVDIRVNVNGGGLTGQADAIRMGLARAIVEYDGELIQAMRDGDFLTRDSRKVERKKPGQPKARKKFQFSKR